MAVDLNRFIKDFERFEKRVSGVIDKRLSGPRMEIFGEAALKQIVKRSRRGFGILASGKRQKRFKALKKSTRDNRKRYAGNLHGTTSVGKSNITATGQMLEALEVTGGRGRFTIGFESGKRKTELHGKRAKNPLTNEEVAFHLENQGRKFLGLTKNEKNSIIKKMKKDLLKQLS